MLLLLDLCARFSNFCVPDQLCDNCPAIVCFDEYACTIFWGIFGRITHLKNFPQSQLNTFKFREMGVKGQRDLQ